LAELVTSGEVGAGESSSDGGDSDLLEGVIDEKEGVDLIAAAAGGVAFSSEVAAGGEKAGVVLATGSADAKGLLTGVVACASGEDDDVPPKTVDPVPLPNVASPPVFHAGTTSGVLDTAWPNAD